MKCWEAMKCLEEGKRVRRKDWLESSYICLSREKNVVDKGGYDYEIGNQFDDNWEIYDDREDCPQEFKDLWKAFQATHCSNKDEIEDFWACVPFSFITMHQEMERLLNEMNKDYKLDE